VSRRWRAPLGSHTKSHPKRLIHHFAHVAPVAPGHVCCAFLLAYLLSDSGAGCLFTKNDLTMAPNVAKM
jgi:hypothetical protein